MLECESADILSEPIPHIISLIGVASRDNPHDHDRFCEDQVDSRLWEGFQLGSTPDVSVVRAIVDEGSSHKGTFSELDLWNDVVRASREKGLVEGHYLEA